MDLLTNAVQSIQLGVEDYQTGTHARLLSAIRNIHAGILLLYKEALLRKSPPNSDDALIKAKIVPALGANGEVIFVGDGTKTVDTQQIRERFERLNIQTDWKRLEQITKLRNDFEHYYPQLAPQALNGLIANAFLIIRSFVAGQLKEEPRDLLGDGTWQTMLKVAEVHAEEKKECEQLLQAEKWDSETLEEGVSDIRCKDCGSDLLKPIKNTYDQIELQCSSCGKAEAPESYVPKAIASALEYESYMAYKDGGESAYVTCPECIEDTYVISERRCALCGHEAEHTCARCSNEIPAEELLTSPLCGYCAHMSTKDD